MKLRRIIFLCAVVLFGAFTAIYAANVTDTDNPAEKPECQLEDDEDSEEVYTEEVVEDPKSLIPSDSAGEQQGEIFKNCVIRDFDLDSTKRMVTKVNGDGTFLVEDLGSWIKKQDVYKISIVEDDGDLKKLYYEFLPEKADRDEYYFEEGDRETVMFAGFVCPGDWITYTENCNEVVTDVVGDGSFYTEYYNSAYSD